jgi:hypothetical protein
MSARVITAMLLTIFSVSMDGPLTRAADTALTGNKKARSE